MVLYRAALFVHGLQRGVGPGGGVRLLVVDRVQEVELGAASASRCPKNTTPRPGSRGSWGYGTRGASRSG